MVLASVDLVPMIGVVAPSGSAISLVVGLSEPAERLRFSRIQIFASSKVGRVVVIAWSIMLKLASFGSTKVSTHLMTPNEVVLTRVEAHDLSMAVCVPREIFFAGEPSSSK